MECQGLGRRRFTDHLGGSLSVLYRDQSDGWIFNRATNRDIGKERNLALRGKLAWADGPLSATLTLGYAKDENDGYIAAAVKFVPTVVPTGLATHVTTDKRAAALRQRPYVVEYPQPSVGDTGPPT